MSRTILNIDGTNRTINPRNGTSVFVDLSSNQSIGGVKTFLNNTNFNTSLTTNLINASAGSNTIELNNKFFNISIGSIDLKGYIIGFPYYTETLTTAIKYMGIVPQSDGNFWIQINNITGKIIYTDWSNKFVKTDWTWYWYNLSGVNTAYITYNGGIAGSSITALSGGTISTSGLVSCGTINCASTITSGAINTTTSNITTTSGSIQSTSGSILSDTFSAVSSNTYINKIQMSNEYANPDVGEIDILSQYIAFVHPSNAPSVSAKYGFFRTFTGGDISLQINNIGGAFLQTDWTNSKCITSFTFESQKTGYTSGYRYNKFMNTASEIGSINMLSSASVNFSVSSDYRLKQDIIPFNNVLEKIKMLNPVTYRFKHDVEEGHDNFIFQGFIAHEVSPIVPLAVSGEKDDPKQMQQMDYAKLTPILTAGVKDLIKEVEELKIYNKSLLDIIDKLIKRVENLEYILM